MKKLFITLSALSLLVSAANAATENASVTQDRKLPQQFEKRFNPPNKGDMERVRKSHEAAFEQKLGLTEVQKLKARELRKSGHAKMKPVMEELKAKRQEAEAIRRSKISVQEQEQKLTEIDKDIAQLEKKANEIKKQNMKDFESILTKDQKKTLKQMKKDGRAKFDKERRPGRPPFPPEKEVKH